MPNGWEKHGVKRLRLKARHPGPQRGAQMQRGLLCSVATTVAALAIFTGAAAAAGPAPPGKDLVNLNCEGIGAVTVSVPRGDDNNGVGQIVGQRGHGIPVSLTVTVTDVTTGTVLDTQSSAVGGGNAHPNQETTTCSGVVFSAPASEFFGEEPLPPGVAPTDTIEVSIVVEVIVKL
jgi:hypothetical protein